MTAEERAERRRLAQQNPQYKAWKKAYDAEKYRRNRERILAQQREHAKSPERAAQLREYQKAYVQKPEVKERRRRAYALRRYGTETLPVRPVKAKPPPKPRPPKRTPDEVRAAARRAYALRHYGTETLPVRPKKVKPCPTPKPPRSTPSSKTTTMTFSARAANPSPRASTRSTTASTSASRTASNATSRPPTPTWTPEMVSHWEPGLDKQGVTW